VEQTHTQSFQEVGISTPQSVGGSLPVKELRQVFGSQVVEGFIGGNEEFEVDTLRDLEPVEVMKDGGEDEQQNSGYVFVSFG